MLSASRESSSHRTPMLRSTCALRTSKAVVRSYQAPFPDTTQQHEHMPTPKRIQM